MKKQNLLDSIEDMHTYLCNKICAYVFENGKEINLHNKCFYKISNSEEFVEKIVLKNIISKEDCVIVNYLAGEGFEPIEMTPYEDDIWTFSFDEYVEIINAIN